MISTRAFKKNLVSILEQIFSNYEYYHSDDVSEKEIAESICDFVEKEEQGYSKSKVFEKNNF